MTFTICSQLLHITKSNKIMTEKKDSIAISLLKQEWDIYSKNHKVTQAQASKKLGWSSSFFGSLLRGTSSVGVENQIKIANLFGIDPHKLNPETNGPLFLSLPIYRTTSGKPPPADSKLFPVFDPDRVCIWSDEVVLVMAGGGYDREEWPPSTEKDTVVGMVPKGVTLLCTKIDYPANLDPGFPSDDLPTWLILEEGKSAKIYISRQKPKTRAGGTMVGNVRTLKKEVLRMQGMVGF
jgi:transcriptional regulator with XRE-family HTH domain